MKIVGSRFFVLTIALCTSLSVFSQKISERQAIKETIHKFFEGLESGDTVRIAETIGKEIKLQTIFVDRNGEHVVRTGSRKKFLNSVATKKPEDVWEEKLLSFEILFDKLLASVWTPYEFYLNGEFSHCGVNSFQLVKKNDVWKIVYLIDSRNRSGCKQNK